MAETAVNHTMTLTPLTPSTPIDRTTIFQDGSQFKQFSDAMQQLKALGLARNIPNISDNTAYTILDLLQRYDVHQLLEIGSANGYSSLYWAYYMREQALKNPQSATNVRHCNAFQVTTIEISSPMACQTINNLAQHKLQYYAQCYWGDACHILRTFKEKAFNAVFIDAQKIITHELLALSLPLIQGYIESSKSSKSFTTAKTSTPPLPGLLIIDDVIKFKDKMQRTFDLLAEKNIAYHIIQTDADDGILWAEI